MQWPAVGAPLPTGKVLAWLGCKRTLQWCRSVSRQGTWQCGGVFLFKGSER